MGVFEDFIEEYEKIDEKERLEKFKEIEGDCVCPICPTYTDCAKNDGENVFCITGKSEKCIDMELGCLCPTCPLAQKLKIGVMYNFYCVRGSESIQRKG
jgi:hypothetical protein